MNAAAWLAGTIAIRFLRQSRAQTLVILVGIAVGVSVIVFIRALIGGLQANIIERTLGTQAHIAISPADEINRPAAAPPGAWRLLLEDKRAQRLRSIDDWQRLQPALEALSGIRAVSPLVSGPGFGRRGEARASVAILGVQPERYQHIIPVHRHLREGVFRPAPGEVAIGSQLAQDLGLRLGGKLRVEAGDGRDAVLTVTGIFELGVRELDSRYVYLDMKQAQALLGLPGGVTRFDATVDDIFMAREIAQRIERLAGLKAESWMQTNAELLNALRSQTLATTMISVFVALSVAIGIASVLAVSVTQRTREIGILRAMGTTRRQMLGVFLLQGAVLGLIGSLAGSLVGLGLTWAFNTFGPRLFYIPLPPGLIPAAMAIATLSGVLAASAPAWRAASMDPAEAIRYV
ncbi:ABC transporter permease [Verticiella sediminum]|uniref:ABC transporter permease n=1 Tax=Verticiella sediminum TaxID=1247510 RepID=A0A556AKJ8_9BURK|nr:ABC transporter permease [Verticiella sediminum]TSH93418.1 ABC transporter permease [Verticiella sediminum]